MKRKSILLAAVGASVGAVAIAAAVATNLDTPELERPAVRAAVTPMEEREAGFWTPGNAIYMGALVGEGHWWNSDNARFVIRYWGDGGVGLSEIATQIENFTWQNGAYNIFETTVPAYPEGVTAWTGAQVLRVAPEWVPENDAATNVWNTTVDIAPQDDSFNCIEVWDDKETYGKYKFGTSTISAADRITSWAGTTGWWGETNNVCDPEGDTVYSELEDAWNASAVTFGKLGYDVKAYFSNLDQLNAPEQGDHLVNNVANQYDGIITKYTELDNFALRNPVYHY